MLGKKSFYKHGLRGLLASISDTLGRDGRYYRWGTADNFPNTVIDSVNNSGTARECIDKLEMFIQGEGIKDQGWAKNTKANPHETWAKLLSQISLHLAYFDGVAIQVLYNKAGLPARYYLIPIQHIRKRYDGDFIYDPTLGDEEGYSIYRNQNRRIVKPYGSCKTPQEARQMIAEQRAKYGAQIGEFLYVYKGGLGLNYEHYPVPKYSAGLNDINADAGLSVSEESQVSNSFKGGVIIETENTLDRTQKDENGQTEYDRFIMTSEAFCSPDGSPVMLLEGIRKNGAGSVTTLNIQHQMDATEKATPRVGRKVCKLMGVPAILCGFETAGKLGESKELVEHMKLFHLGLKRKWALKQEVLTALFPKIPTENFETEPIELFDFVEPEVIKRMTQKQLNKAFNLPQDDDAELENVASATGEKQAVKREVNEHLTTMRQSDLNRANRVVEDYRKGKYEEGQAVMLLTQKTGFTTEEAKEFLGIQEIEKPLGDGDN